MELKRILFLNSKAMDKIIAIKRPYNLNHEDRIFYLEEYQITVDNYYTSSNINDFDITILTIRDFWYDRNKPDESYSQNCIRRKQEIITSLKEGKTIILLVEESDDLLIQTLGAFGINVEDIKDYTKDLKTNLIKFKEIVERYCNVTTSFKGPNLNPICSFDKQICGFYSSIGKGKLYVLPVVLKNHYKDHYLELFNLILKNISSIDSEFNLPQYLKDHMIIDESELITEKNKSIQRISEIDSQLNDINIIKSILILKHDFLVDNLIFTLNKMDIKTHKLEKYEEDFWIMNDTEKEIIIEVKGTKSNFSRKFINDLDNHREENGLQDDFPALLIVNSFSDANSLVEKYIAPEADTLKRAKSHNIMVTRTLDIFNLYTLIKSGGSKLNEFLSIVKEKECGWVKITDKIELIKEEKENDQNQGRNS